MPTDFTRGRATITITSGDQQSGFLDRIGNNTFYARFDPTCPASAQAEWTDSTGKWLLTVLANAEPNDAWAGQQATFTIERYAGEPPLFASSSGCAITITEISRFGLAGDAHCRGLRWFNDYDAQTNPEGAVPLPQLPPFDVSIAFEARP